MEQKRFNFIDCGRLVCILWVCIVHSGTRLPDDLGIGILLMPFFFFIFGFFCKPEKYTFGKFAAARFKQILIPFFLVQPFCFVLDLFRSNIFALGVSAADFAKSYFLFSLYGSGVFPPFSFFGAFSLPQFGETQSSISCSLLNTPTWFLPVMFTASLLFYPLARLLEKKCSLLNLSAVLFCLFYLAGIETQFTYTFQLPWGLGRAFLAAGIMLIGSFVRKKGIFENTSKRDQLLIYAASVVSISASILTGTTGDMVCTNYMSEAGYYSVLILGVGGTALSCALLIILKRLEEKYGKTKLFQLIALSGRKTMWIYILHVPVFFFFDMLFFACGIQPEPFNYNCNLYPYNMTTFLPHAVQVICTVVFCIFVACAWEKHKNNSKHLPQKC
ncbi:MAG: acyltransferase [Synergistes sp.]|nr:acyltransferase [Synergistes sp.]